MPACQNSAYVDELDEPEFEDSLITQQQLSPSSGLGSPPEPITTGSEPKKRRERHQTIYITVAILCCINLINYMDRYTIAGVLTDVQKYYSLSNTEAGLIQTSFVVSFTIMAPVFGYLGDRYSRTAIIACGVTFWCITTLLGSFVSANHFGLFIFLRALVGTGEASYSTIAPTIIADFFAKDRRSKVLAIFYFAIPVGSGLGYIVGQKVAEGLGSWQWSLRITPAIGIVCVFLLIIFMRDPPRGEAEGGAGLRATSLCNDLIDLHRTRSYVWSTLGFTCVTFATGALAWWAPKYMDIITKLNGNSVDATFAFGIITCVAGIVGVLIGSYSSRHWRRKNPRADPLICAIGVLLCVPFAFVGLVIADENITVSWILIFLGEICLCVNWTIVADMLLYVIIPTRRSIAEAVQILTSHALGDATSPYICGMVSDAIAMYSTSNITEYLCLQYSLYVPIVVLVFGGLCFFLAALHIEKDRMKCSLITHGSLPPLYTFPDVVSVPKPIIVAAEDLLDSNDQTYLV